VSGSTFWLSVRRSFSEWVRALLGESPSTRFTQALLAIALVTLAAQVSVMSSFIARNIATRAEIAAIDNDGGVAIGTATHTKLYDDNGWRPYGPLYYRLVRILHHLGTHPHATDSTSSDERIEMQNSRERSHHFLLAWVSLISLVGLCALLACLITTLPVYRVLLTSALLTAFTSHPTWAEMILRPHPDHLFAALIGLATWASWKWLTAPQAQARTRLILMGAAWGLAASCKMTVLVFAPGVIALFIGRRPIFDFRSLGTWMASALTTYLLVGFPQSFNFGGVIEFLLQQSKNVLPATWESIVNWLDLFATQIWRPLAVVGLGLLFLSSPRTTAASRTMALRLSLLVILPIAYLFSKKIISPISWYPLPFIAAILAALVLGTNGLRSRWAAWTNWTHRWPAQLGAWILIPFFYQGVPSTWNQALAEQQRCRAEARRVEAQVNAAAQAGGHILVDPYIPYSQIFHDREVEMAWEMRLDRIRPDTKLIALKSEYYRWYLPVDSGGSGGAVLHIQNLEPVREFYLKFWQQTKAMDPLGREWRKVYDDACTFEIWAPVLADPDRP